MPCQSDYLAASGQELESRRVCEFLVRFGRTFTTMMPSWVAEAANNYYGNTDRLDEATAMLCNCLRRLSPEQLEEFVYDAHNPESRRLAAWWERHQEWDKRRKKEEEETRRKIILRERALRKLTVDEMKALDLQEGKDKQCEEADGLEWNRDYGDMP